MINDSEVRKIDIEGRTQNDLLELALFAVNCFKTFLENLNDLKLTKIIFMKFRLGIIYISVIRFLVLCPLKTMSLKL